MTTLIAVCVASMVTPLSIMAILALVIEPRKVGVRSTNSARLTSRRPKPLSLLLAQVLASSQIELANSSSRRCIRQ